MLKRLILTLLVFNISQPAYSLTRLDQSVKVMNYTQGQEKLYRKNFSELKLDKKTMSFILEHNEKLDKMNADSYYLAFIRIDNDKVSKIMFIGEKGNVASYDIKNKKKCHLSLNPAQSMSDCKMLD